MARLHGKDGRVLLNALSVSGQINGWSVNHSRAYSMTACLGDDGDRWEPGQLSGSMTLKGFVDTTTGLRSEAVTAAGVDDSLFITVFPAAFTVGTPAVFCVADVASWLEDATIREAVPIQIQAKADNSVDMGYVLHGLTAETTSTNAASVDNGAATTNGAAAMLHLTAFSGLTNIVIKVQHSTNNSTWVDLMTFTTATATTKERVTVTGTVNQYLRALWTVTGTGSATFAVAAARR